MTRVTVPRIYVECETVEVVTVRRAGYIEIKFDGDRLIVMAMTAGDELPTITTTEEDSHDA